MDANRSSFFEPVSPSCVVAEMAHHFDDAATQEKYSLQSGLLGAIILTTVSILVNWRDLKILNKSIPEPLYIFCLLALYNFGIAYTSAVDVVLIVYELPHSKDSLVVETSLNIMAFLFGMFWRCLHLKISSVPASHQSWMNYLTSEFEKSRWQRVATWIVCFQVLRCFS